MVLGSHLKKKIYSTNKTIHFIFLVQTKPKIIFEEVSKLKCPTTCGLLTDSKEIINLQTFKVCIVKPKCCRKLTIFIYDKLNNL